MKYLGYDEERLKELDGYWTAREIEQQPSSLLHVSEYLLEHEERITQFIAPHLSNRDWRIILTGAGTSAFAGSCLAPSLSRALGKQIEAIATTDIVSSPESYFRPDIPTLLVSFARSGNSPESVAAVELSQSMVKQSFQLVLTCNKEGELYRSCENRENCLVLLMPEETNDRAFAMTSSFTSMMFAAISTFVGIRKFSQKDNAISDSVATLIKGRNAEIKELADANASRVIYLGSNSLSGLAQEASLKLLELTDGCVHTLHDSPLGVRHGPKASLNDDTLVVIFMSSDSYTRKYDIDILKELSAEQQVKRVVAVTADNDVDTKFEEFFTVQDTEQFSDLELIFPFIAFAQMYGFHNSLRVGNRPDNPSASGTVNRVVQGVRIYSRTT